MGRICIMNSSPEFSVSSCNTVCNSRISSILCVPPMRLSATNKNAKFDDKQKSKRTNSNSKDVEECLIDTDSSEEDLGDSQSDDLHRINSTSIPPPPPPPINPNETKYSTMWIGNDDGCLYVFQFTDQSIRTIARKNRTLKQLSSSILGITYASIF